jgi:1-acyl-sn-glycerol-3-phosphate acyltransferase
MLYFLFAYLWSWVIVPCSFVILRPFVRLDYNLNARHFLYTVLGIKQQITGDKLIGEGFILANHRCFLDALIDCYVSNSIGISRQLTILGGPFIILFAYIDNRVILINRDKDNRHDVYLRCTERLHNKRIVFYPEGTRNNYTSLKSCDELKSYIKFGLLKSIYEDKRYPVQMMISNNKEIAFNEKKLHAKYGVHIHTKISKSIHPKDFATDTEFFDEIVKVWFDCYVELGNLQGEPRFPLTPSFHVTE